MERTSTVVANRALSALVAAPVKTRNEERAHSWNNGKWRKHELFKNSQLWKLAIWIVLMACVSLCFILFIITRILRTMLMLLVIRTVPHYLSDADRGKVEWMQWDQNVHGNASQSATRHNNVCFTDSNHYRNFLTTATTEEDLRIFAFSLPFQCHLSEYSVTRKFAWIKCENDGSRVLQCRRRIECKSTSSNLIICIHYFSVSKTFPFVLPAFSSMLSRASCLAAPKRRWLHFLCIVASTTAHAFPSLICSSKVILSISSGD